MLTVFALIIIIIVVTMLLIYCSFATKSLHGGGVSPSPAVIAQINGRGDQDKYLIGDKGDEIEDDTKPNGTFIKCSGAYGPFGHFATPAVKREVNYPNKVFGWGDVINRYWGDKAYNDISL
jgi:hypothetical protein